MTLGFLWTNSAPDSLTEMGILILLCIIGLLISAINSGKKFEEQLDRESKKLGITKEELRLRYQNDAFKRNSRNIAPSKRKALLEAYNYKCAYCGSSVNLQIDHIHPVSKGGWKNWDNLQVLCQDCNLRKSNKL
jgi:predicted restriction endonuclease